MSVGTVEFASSSSTGTGSTGTGSASTGSASAAPPRLTGYSHRDAEGSDGVRRSA
jgi:hypothetical protein